MAKSTFHSICLLIVFFTSFLITDAAHFGPLKNHVALFIFGDSLFDAGNNNYINTTFKANYKPYGETFFHYPTGRFSDGRLIPDFIAEYAKLPLIPPYLQPGIYHQLTNGVNFASSGAGALAETRRGIVIDLQTQLGYFENVSRQLRKKLGDAEAESLLSRAVYLFSVGGNDYLFPFEINSTVLRSYSPEQFVGLVIGNITAVVKEIYKTGGRKFGFVNMLPISCVPYSKALLGGGQCFEQITPYVELHNKELPKSLQKLERELKGFKYSLLPFYTFLEQRINHPSKYGFKEAKAACCGSGPFRGIFSCGGKRGVKEYYLCQNPSEYVFFDSIHLTERAYQQFAKPSWNGKPTLSGSYSLKALFESN
ncbi:GDSL esterase/lipase 2-like [Ziziphus jujuba]|uniref:GDSL esterase/lipase 2-like n=1 Tax=Ziziphus jujuba TaxID=326968 RepID=A0A6P4BDC6_ZIZJJ|nr:GDSL esterase/lipase 2-like [Ziziphus jujuba]